MENISWLKQIDSPLFPDLLWSRPENKATAGKLLIIGGHSYSFAAPAGAYQTALSGGIGSLRVVLPDSTKKLLAKNFPEAEFAPSTPSGSFSRQALANLLDAADWADGVFLAGDLGHNSETAVLLENFVGKFKGPLSLCGDSLDYFTGSGKLILNRPNTLIAADFSRLQKLAKNNNPGLKILSTMSLYELAKALTIWTNDYGVGILTDHQNQAIVAVGDKVSTTASVSGIDKLAAVASVWWLQNPTKQFEAITTAIWANQNQ